MEHGFTLRVSSTVLTIMATRKIRAAAIATPAQAGTLAPMRSATARSQTYTPEIGKACTFRLTNTIVEQRPIFKKIFPDKTGNPIRYLFAGKTTSNTFINEQTGGGITFEPNVGSITRGFVNDNGTITFVSHLSPLSSRPLHGIQPMCPQVRQPPNAWAGSSPRFAPTKPMRRIGIACRAAA